MYNILLRSISGDVSTQRETGITKKSSLMPQADRRGFGRHASEASAVKNR